jgi:hypothetical protein
MFVKEARRKGGGVAPREGVYLQQSLAPGCGRRSAQKQIK